MVLFSHPVLVPPLESLPRPSGHVTAPRTPLRCRFPDDSFFEDPTPHRTIRDVKINWHHTSTPKLPCLPVSLYSRPPVPHRRPFPTTVIPTPPHESTTQAPDGPDRLPTPGLLPLQSLPWSHLHSGEGVSWCPDFRQSTRNRSKSNCGKSIDHLPDLRP